MTSFTSQTEKSKTPWLSNGSADLTDHPPTRLGSIKTKDRSHKHVVNRITAASSSAWYNTRHSSSVPTCSTVLGVNQSRKARFKIFLPPTHSFSSQFGQSDIFKLLHQRAASHSEESAICPLAHPQAHRRLWLSSVTFDWRGRKWCPFSRPETQPPMAVTSPWLKTNFLNGRANAFSSPSNHVTCWLLHHFADFSSFYQQKNLNSFISLNATCPSTKKNESCFETGCTEGKCPLSGEM